MGMRNTARTGRWVGHHKDFDGHRIYHHRAQYDAGPDDRVILHAEARARHGVYPCTWCFPHSEWDTE